MRVVTVALRGKIGVLEERQGLWLAIQWEIAVKPKGWVSIMMETLGDSKSLWLAVQRKKKTVKDLAKRNG